MPPAPVFVWFRDDLRLSDHPALHAAVQTGLPIFCFYVLDETSPQRRPMGGAAKWWLHHGLSALRESLTQLGGDLHIFEGAAEGVVERLVDQLKPSAVFWNRRYDDAGMAVDARIKTSLRDQGIVAESYNGALLREPWEVKNGAGLPFKVFTPFWKSLQGLGSPPAPLPAPEKGFFHKGLDTLAVADLALLPTKPDWAGGMRAEWQVGEMAAQKRLYDFMTHDLKGYADNRDRPDLASTSRLSPYLRFGHITPRQIWYVVRQAENHGTFSSRDAEKFLAEVGWREFSHHLLYQFPDLAFKNFQPRFDAFPWGQNGAFLLAWQRGLTGYPIVDAGMRELWQTGWMHNRVRMIAASFLIKHLLIPWQRGEEWFWDTLVDACPANNAASWQWVAGSGADAAPYFRIFNPMLQGEKFDPNGDYVRRYVPELARVPAPLIHKPWLGSPELLRSYGVTLGATYPKPLVEHEKAREKALEAFQALGRA